MGTKHSNFKRFITWMDITRFHAMEAVLGALLALCTVAGCKSVTTQETSNASSAEVCDGAVFHNTCVHTGDIVTFGNYFQSNDETKEPIAWRVLEIDKDNKKMLLLSEYVIDAKPYHTEKVSITWEKCSLRTWLNGDFKDMAFTSSEQQQIALTHLENPSNQFYGTNGGNATDDYVFLLSLADALSQNNEVPGSGKYFSSNADREALATKYAIGNGVYVFKNVVYEYEQSSVTYKEISIVQFSAQWWLRSPGHDTSDAALLYDSGYVYHDGFYVTYEEGGVRPAMWVKYE